MKKLLYFLLLLLPAVSRGQASITLQPRSVSPNTIGFQYTYPGLARYDTLWNAAKIRTQISSQISTALASYVPYTGAGNDVNLAGKSLNATVLVLGDNTIGTANGNSWYISQTSTFNSMRWVKPGTNIGPVIDFVKDGTNVLTFGLFNNGTSINGATFVYNGTLQANNAPVAPTDVLRLQDLGGAVPPSGYAVKDSTLNPNKNLFDVPSKTTARLNLVVYSRSEIDTKVQLKQPRIISALPTQTTTRPIVGDTVNQAVAKLIFRGDSARVAVDGKVSKSGDTMTGTLLGLDLSPTNTAISNIGTLSNYYASIYGNTAYCNFIRGLTSNITFNSISGTAYARMWNSSGNWTIQTGGTYVDNGFKLDVVGTIQAAGNVTPSATNNYNLGSTTSNWGTVHTRVIASATNIISSAASLNPNTNNTYNLGSGALRWGAVFSVTSNTSGAATFGGDIISSTMAAYSSGGYTDIVRNATSGRIETLPAVQALRLTGSGTGAATTISFPHGQSGITAASIAVVTPINAASSGISYVTCDATNVNVTWATAPVSGTGNVQLNVFLKP